MLRHHFIDPAEALKMVLIELARLRRSQRGEDAGRIPTEDGTVGHVR